MFSSTEVAPRSANSAAGLPLVLVKPVTVADSVSPPDRPGARSSSSSRGRSRPRVARTQPAQLQRAERHALERPHRVADRLEHAPHDPVAALVDRDLEHRLPAGRGDHAHARRPGASVLELDAAPQGLQRPLRRSARDPRHGRCAAPRSAGASAGWRARRRWSGAPAPCCRRRGARPGTGGRPTPPCRSPSAAPGVVRGGHHSDGLVDQVVLAAARGVDARRRRPRPRRCSSTSRAGSVTTLPSTRTRPPAPAARRARREATPAWARYFASRISRLRLPSSRPAAAAPPRGIMPRPWTYCSPSR